MPELPDVENYGRYFKRHGLKKTITGVAVGDTRALDHISPRQLQKHLVGAKFTATRRHGKQLFVRVSSGGWLTMHFGMTGSLAAFTDEKDEPSHDRVRFDFGRSGHLGYIDPRLFGRVGYARDAAAFIKAHKLGPDALDPKLTLGRFKDALAGGGGLKATLMDQSRLAGIGNVFADEILFQTKLHPLMPAGRLTPAELKALLAAMRKIFRTAIAAGAGAEGYWERLPRTYLLRQRGKGGVCPRGHGPLSIMTAAGRTTYFCGQCQKRV
ncbi:MAG: Fpg/Nei family DNA glycosylase [Alphaproteobacteria bacterium]|nr:Fpg/Nei family DNA glycosylase [Alphaproteobacteria bacterium]